MNKSRPLQGARRRGSNGTIKSPRKSVVGMKRKAVRRPGEPDSEMARLTLRKFLHNLGSELAAVDLFAKIVVQRHPEDAALCDFAAEIRKLLRRCSSHLSTHQLPRSLGASRNSV